MSVSVAILGSLFAMQQARAEEARPGSEAASEKANVGDPTEGSEGAERAPAESGPEMKRTVEEESGDPGSNDASDGDDAKKDHEESMKERFEAYRRSQLSSFSIGGFGSPNSDFGNEGGLILGQQSYGDTGRRYGSDVAQLEIGNGVGLEFEGYSTHNILEIEGPISPILGGHLFDFDGDFNSNGQSHDYIAWAFHGDGGLRLGRKDGCFAALVGGIGLNSGTQSLGPGDWFRKETGALAEVVCGPIAAGVTARHIDDADGTVATLTASALALFGSQKNWGFGAAFVATGYEAAGDYTTVFENPFLAVDSDFRQTMLRITFQGRFGGEEEGCEAEQ